MLTVVDMMSRVKLETGLAPRLLRLTGEEASCCVPEYRGWVRTITQDPEYARVLARARALADESRLSTLSLLRTKKELCACEIQAALGLSHATVSHHMSILMDAGFIWGERRGKWMFYGLAPGQRGDVV